MSNLHDRIQKVATEFARHVLGMLRGMTLDELVNITHLGRSAPHPVEAPRAPRAAKRPARAAKATVRTSRPKRRVANTPKMAAARKVQGQYMGLLRKFTGTKREQIKAVARKNSVAAAVAEMKKLLGR
jgi:hypothetical protein